jgi:hypothetical protein
MAVLEPTHAGYYLWHYLPSVPAAVIFCLFFLLMTAILGWHAYCTHAWTFCAAFLVGDICTFSVAQIDPGRAFHLQIAIPTAINGLKTLW